jgi:hypothetical protein
MTLLGEKRINSSEKDERTLPDGRQSDCVRLQKTLCSRQRNGSAKRRNSRTSS